MIFGIHHESGGSANGLALAHEFSAKSEKHDAAFLDNRVWPYIDSNRDKVITAGIIYDSALRHGWVEDISGYFEDRTEDDAESLSPVTT